MLRCKTDIKFYQFPIRVHFSAGKMKIIGVYSGKCNNESEKNIVADPEVFLRIGSGINYMIRYPALKYPDNISIMLTF